MAAAKGGRYAVSALLLIAMYGGVPEIEPPRFSDQVGFPA